MIQLIIDIAKDDNLVFLFPALARDTIYREDSSSIPSSNPTSNSSSLSQNWEAEEKKTRIMQKIDAATTELTESNEYVAYSWEDIVFLQNEQTSS
ncbi:hypothetical protein BDF21DRAFT_348766 [Thamnidium elegans]|nr:hypothetical protein BDF21DRAFT_348766 [Thamnidium elegans]